MVPILGDHSFRPLLSSAISELSLLRRSELGPITSPSIPNADYVSR